MSGSTVTKEGAVPQAYQVSQIFLRYLERLGQENHYLTDEEIQVQQKKYDQMHDVAKKAGSKLMTMVEVAAEVWIREQLTPRNIAQIEQVYFPQLKLVVRESRSQIDCQTSIYPFYMILDQQCHALCKQFLGEVKNRIETFYSNMTKVFNDHSLLSTTQLLDIGIVEFKKINQDTSNAEIQQLIHIGCLKLMNILSAQNDIIQDIFSRALTFYKNQLANLPEAEIYSPAKLNAVHTNLEKKLCAAVWHAFSLIRDFEGLLCFDMFKKIQTLKDLIQQEFTAHVAAKHEKLKLLQEQMSSMLVNPKSVHKSPNEKVLERDDGGTATQQKTRQVDLNETAHQEAQPSRSSKIDKKATQAVCIDDKFEPIEEKARSDVGRCKEYKSEGHVEGNQANKADMNLEKSNSLGSSRQELLDKCEEIKSNLNGGNTYTIKSAVTKKIFMQKIDDATKIATNPTATLEQINAQMETLESWSSKYRK